MEPKNQSNSEMNKYGRKNQFSSLSTYDHQDQNRRQNPKNKYDDYGLQSLYDPIDKS